MGERRHYSWSKSDEEKVIQCVEMHGRNWIYIEQTYFPLLTSSQIKYKYYGILRREDRRCGASAAIEKFIVDDISSQKTARVSTPHTSARLQEPQMSREEIIQQIIRMCSEIE